MAVSWTSGNAAILGRPEMASDARLRQGTGCEFRFHSLSLSYRSERQSAAADFLGLDTGEFIGRLENMTGRAL